MSKNLTNHNHGSKHIVLMHKTYERHFKFPAAIIYSTGFDNPSREKKTIENNVLLEFQFQAVS